MAGRGPAPKPDSIRSRRNRHTTAATLPSEREIRERLRGKKLPRLPRRTDGEEWDRRTSDWWREAMRSPMAEQYLAADRHGLLLAFTLIDEFYDQADDARGSKGRVSRLVMLAVEIRQQIARFGLTPRDRLSLHWHVPPDEEDEAPRGPGGPPAKIEDYRQALGEESGA